MVKYFCDACNKEIFGRHYNISLLKHIVDGGIGFDVVFEDNKFHSVSGVDVTKQLCLSCYNDVMGVLWGRINEISSASNGKN